MSLPRTMSGLEERLPALEKTGRTISRTIHRGVLKGGAPTRSIADLLHGTWLGHPLHPVLTDFTIGAWVAGGLFDLMAGLRRSGRARRQTQRTADALAVAGTAFSIPTVITGMADYSAIQKPALSAATIHALLNDINVGLYLASIAERRRGNRRRGVLYSSMALGLTAVSAWIGGYLVYGHKVGVDHNTSRQGPTDWTPVLADADLGENRPVRVEAGESQVLLYRSGGDLYAIGAVCSHAGGPLEEGAFEGCSVQCPWHDSVFDLRTGKVRHGPATHAQPLFETRVRDGQVEVRLAQP